MKYNFNGFTSKANEALNLSISFAESMGHTYVGSEHLLLGLLKLGSGVAYSVLTKNGVTAEDIEEQLRTQIGSGTPTRLSPDYFTPRAKKAIETAMRGCSSMGKKYAGTEHLLIGILSEGDNFAIRFINGTGADVSLIINEVLKAGGIEAGADMYAAEKGKSTNEKGDSVLAKYGIALTEEARKGKIAPVIGRETEIGRVIQIL